MALLQPLRTSERAGNRRPNEAVMTQKGFSRQTNTQIGSRPRARGGDTGFAAIYELSRGLHRAASWRVERFGPIRISPLQ